MGFRIAQDGRGIGQAARRDQTRGNVVKTGELNGDALLLVGAGKMGHQRDSAHSARALEALQRGAEDFWPEAEPVHAAVELEKHVDLDRQSGHFEHFDLFRAVDDAGQPVFRQDRQLVRAEKSFQQQNGLVETGLAQRHRLFHIEHGETIGGFKRMGHPQHAMAIAIGFDHGHRSGLRRMAASHAKIVPECREIDSSLERTA